MTTRSQWLRNRAQHDQRHATDPTPRKVNPDAATAWIPEFVSSLEGLETPIKIGSVIASQLGDHNEQDRKLRHLAQRGILYMRAIRLDVAGRSVFSHYEWEVVS